MKNLTVTYISYHASVAKGGIGMTTIAYASVSKSGLSFPHHFLVNGSSLRMRTISSKGTITYGKLNEKNFAEF